MTQPNDAGVDSSTTEQVLDAAGTTTEATDTSTQTRQDSSDSQVEKTEETSKMPPLHEHPRFKEVIAEKNEWQKKFEELQSQIKGKTDAKESDFSDEGEVLYSGFKERFMKELAEMAEAKEQEKTQKEMEIQQTLDNFKKKFDGGNIPESFKEFATNRIKIYKNATLDELYDDWQATNPQVDKVAGPSSSGGQTATKTLINRDEDFITAARRAMMGK